jgi:uncharacterized protein
MSDSSFLGTGWSFPPEFDVRDKRSRMSSAAEDIRESLRILLTTSPGERVMLPTFGCGLRARVFDPASESMITEVKDAVERAILYYEPRITLNDLEVRLVDPLGGEVEIEVFYTIRTTNTRSNLVYKFYLLEGTNTGLTVPLGEIR